MVRPRSFSLITAIQSVAAVVVLAAVAGLPPAHGFMLIVPLRPAARPAAIAARSGGRLVGAGLFSGSIVVLGDRSAILPAAIADGSIVVAAGGRACARRIETPS